MKFRCHIVNCSNSCCKFSRPITALCRRSKPEVSNLNIVPLIEEDVFWLQITMTHTIVMHVFQSLKELHGMEASDGFRVSTSNCNEIE